MLKKKNGHPTSSILISAVHTQFLPPLFFFFLGNPSYRANFQPLFLYGLSFTTKFLCDPFHRAHHGNLVRPGKNAPQRTQGHILYKKGGQSIWIFLSFFFFFSFSFFFPLFQQLLRWHGEKKKKKKHKTGSVWQENHCFL